MEDNLVALLQIIEDFQREYRVTFDIWAGSKETELVAVAYDGETFDYLATVERR